MSVSYQLASPKSARLTHLVQWLEGRERYDPHAVFDPRERAPLESVHGDDVAPAASHAAPAAAAQTSAPSQTVPVVVEKPVPSPPKHAAPPPSVKKEAAAAATTAAEPTSFAQWWAKVRDAVVGNHAALVGATALVGAVGVAIVGNVVLTKLRTHRRRQALVATIAACAREAEPTCHLFIYPRCPLGPSWSTACMEAEAYLRVARIPYTVHYVAAAADIAYALDHLPSPAQPLAITRSEVPLYTSEPAGGTPTTNRSVTPRRRLSRLGSTPPPGASDTASTTTPRAATPTRATPPSYTRRFSSTLTKVTSDLPMLMYGRSGIYIGCQAIVDFAVETYSVKLDRNFTNEESGVGRALRDQSKYSLAAYVNRTLRDHPHVAAKVMAKKRRISPLHARLLLWAARSTTRVEVVTNIDTLTREEYETAFLHEIVAFESLLGQKAFVVGFTPSSYDCAVYAALLPVYLMGSATMSPLNAALAYFFKSKTLPLYMQRVTRLAFPDMEALLKSRSRPGRSVKYEAPAPPTTPSQSRESSAVPSSAA